jgi:predicted  nucleic acid-binding Zn-ribbon protein
LLAKISENAALIESNRVLRVEKQTLEERLSKKSDELIAAESEISPLKQEVITLRSERDYIKIENETLQNSIDQWRKRATSIMTKVWTPDLPNFPITDIYRPIVSIQKLMNSWNRRKSDWRLRSAPLKVNLQERTIRYGTSQARELVYQSHNQVVKWKDAQQQWKNAVQNVTEQSKERQSQLAAERDAANAQAEAITKELESAKAEVMRLSKQSQELAASATGASSTDSNAIVRIWYKIIHHILT